MTATTSAPPLAADLAAIHAHLETLYGTAEAGHLPIWSTPGNLTDWVPITELDECASVIQQRCDAGSNVFHGMGLHPRSLGSGSRGKADGVTALPGIYMDLDLRHPSHKQAELPESVEEVTDLLKELQLPPSLLIHSGHGLHAHWLFKEILTITTPEERERASSALKQLQGVILRLGRARGWKFESTTDLARVLRPAGVVNRKIESEPVLTRVLHDGGERYQLKEIEDSLPDDESSSTTCRDDAPIADIERILDGCAFMAHCRDDAATLPEPEWHSMLSIVSLCEDGERHAHELGKPYPGYSHPETQQMYERVRKADKPVKCETVEERYGKEWCAGCAHRGTITSPIQVGQPPIRDSAPAGPYLVTPSGFIYRRNTQNGPVDQPLSNFTARIAEEVIADDGASERVELVIEGTLGGQALPAIRVSTRRFNSLNWPNDEWGSRPIIAAGFGNRDRLREAIQRHSPDVARRRVYEHPGWRNLPEHGWCYLHTGGAIGAIGAIADIDVALRGAAAQILLPEPPCGDALRDAVRACLSLLDVAPTRTTAPLFGAIYRAPLGELAPADTSVFLVGPTGVFKTELSALGMQHVGVTFDRLHLPAQWSSTPNALERVAFDFKDAPLVIDDFAPHGTQADIARLHATADRVLRGVGNRGARGRMRADGSLRPDYPPRGMVIGTGEDAPRGQSLRSRAMILEVAPGDVDRERLTAAQADGRAGHFAAGLAGFVRWLAAHFDDLRESLPTLLADLRARAYDSQAHARTPEAVAHLAVGWWAFLRFAAECGALARDEAEAAFARAWQGIGDAATRQSGYQAGEEPARRFLDLLSSALAAGHVHIASPEGRVPLERPGAWGWREERIGGSEYERYEWRPQGSRAGWIDGDDLYLDLEAALAGTQRISQASGSGVAVTPKTLAKRLHEQRFLRSTEREGELKVRRHLDGVRRRVLHLASETLALEESRQSRQSDHNGAEPTPSSGDSPSVGGILWRDFPADDQETCQPIPPQLALSRANGGIGGIGGIFVTETATNGANGHAPERVGADGVTRYRV